MFGSKKTTVINTTTVDNNIYLNNDIQNEIEFTAEVNPEINNAFLADVRVDTAPIADAVSSIVAPMDRMAQSVLSTMQATQKQAADAAERQTLGMAAIAGGLASIGKGLGGLGDGLSEMKKDDEEGFAKIAGSLEGVTKIAGAILAVAAVYFMFFKGRRPDVEVGI